MKISRIIKVVILLIIIAFCSTFVVFRYFGNKDVDNWFNEGLRGYVTRFPTMRSMYGLHWDGDAKSDYLSNKKYKSLMVEIDGTDRCRSVLSNNQELLVNEISNLVQKPEGVEIDIGSLVDDDELIFLESNAFDRAINKIINRLRGHRTNGDQAVFYVLCIDYHRDNPSWLANTYQEDSMLLFYDRANEIAGNNYEALSVYLTTSLLHEFGHQLGLGHVNDPNCIMANRVEYLESDSKFDKIPQDFCQLSFDRLEIIRQAYEEK